MILDYSALDSRNGIIQLIKNNPGIHLRKIKNMLGRSMGTVQYHVSKLEKDGLIFSKRSGFYKNYYHVDESENNDIMSILNLESPRRILSYLAKNEPCSHSDLSKGVGLSTSTVSWHMKKLVDAEIVQLSYDGKFSIYTIKNKSELILILRKFQSSTWNDMVENMTDMFTAFQQDEN